MKCFPFNTVVKPCFVRPCHENHIIPYNHGFYNACITYWTWFPAYKNSVRSPKTPTQSPKTFSLHIL